FEDLEHHHHVEAAAVVDQLAGVAVLDGRVMADALAGDLNRALVEVDTGQLSLDAGLGDGVEHEALTAAELEDRRGLGPVDQLDRLVVELGDDRPLYG